VRDPFALCLLTLPPVVREQKPAAPFGEPVDVNRSPAIRRPLHQGFVAEAKKVGVELAPATEGQCAGNLTGVMPAPIVERLKHQQFQLAALPHRRILAEFVSTFFFVTGTRPNSTTARETAKASTFQPCSRHGNSV
jgi:hypothetical protein